MHLADEETIRPQSTACTGCGATDCAVRPCLLRRLVASQLLASRALVASQLARFADLAVPASRDLMLSAGDMDTLIAILANSLGSYYMKMNCNHMKTNRLLRIAIHYKRPRDRHTHLLSNPTQQSSIPNTFLIRAYISAQAGLSAVLGCLFDLQWTGIPLRRTITPV